MPPSSEFLARVRARMTWFDRLPPETRALVNEHSQRIVQAFLDGGMTDPRRIAHVLNVLTDANVYANGRAGGRQTGPQPGVGGTERTGGQQKRGPRR